MHVTVNGKPVECAEGTSLHALILELGLKPEAVVAERNRELVPGAQFEATRLDDGDTLEVLHFVGGG